jgi:hypothetical protein
MRAKAESSTRILQDRSGLSRGGLNAGCSAPKDLLRRPLLLSLTCHIMMTLNGTELW